MVYYCYAHIVNLFLSSAQHISSEPHAKLRVGSPALPRYSARQRPHKTTQITFNHYWLVVWIPWKIWKPVWMMKFPVCGRIKHVPNHQTLLWNTPFDIITWVTGSGCFFKFEIASGILPRNPRLRQSQGWNIEVLGVKLGLQEWSIKLHTPTFTVLAIDQIAQFLLLVHCCFTSISICICLPKGSLCGWNQLKWHWPSTAFVSKVKHQWSLGGTTKYK